MSSIIFFSAFFSCIMGFVGYFVLDILNIEFAAELSVLFGGIFFVLLCPTMLISNSINKRKYEKFEKELNRPVFYKVNANLNFDNNPTRNGYVYFSESGIICVCLDEKPYTYDEFNSESLEKYEVVNRVNLKIYTKDGKSFVMTTPDIRKTLEILNNTHWFQE